MNLIRIDSCRIKRTGLKRFFLLAILCFAGTASFAQPNNFVNRTINWAYKIVEGDSAKPKKKYVFVVPIWSYKPETRWQYGVSVSHFFKSKNDSVTRMSVIRTNIVHTLNNQFSVRPFVDWFSAQNVYNVRGIFQYTDFVESYWGIGPQAKNDNEEVYSFKQLRANVKATRLITPGLYAGLHFSVENLYRVDLSDAPKMELSQVKGSTGFFEWGLGPVFSFDNRNHIYFPTKGHFIDVGVLLYQKTWGSNSNFTSFQLDARKYLKLWKENVLALQLYTVFNEGNAPFRMMGTLGNESYFRGYYFGRFRDNHAATCQAELRQQVWGPIGIVLFGGFGNVSNTIPNLTQAIKPMYGAGLRIKAIPREKINLRLDYAWGEKGISAPYITLSEAF